jgi:hypothetical protein
MKNLRVFQRMFGRKRARVTPVMQGGHA